MKTLSILAFIIAAGWGFVMLSADHDKAVEAGAQKYETCIRKEYQESPAEIYEATGAYPVCN